MRHRFWAERWQSGQTGWHQEAVNALLVKYWPRLGLPQGCPVFVPLCGKSHDMLWLRRQGHRVIGVEFVESAVRGFFEERGVVWKVADTPNELPRYSGGGIHIYCGDYLQLSASHLEAAPGAFDRGALIALPPDMRAVYADHMQRLLPEGARTLLLTLVYDQGKVAGPPFSVPQDELQGLYGQRCRIEALETFTTDEVPPHFKEAGVAEVREAVHLLTKLD